MACSVISSRRWGECVGNALLGHFCAGDYGVADLAKEIGQRMGVAVRAFPGESMAGDHHIFVLNASN